MKKGFLAMLVTLLFLCCAVDALANTVPATIDFSTSTLSDLAYVPPRYMRDNNIIYWMADGYVMIDTLNAAGEIIAVTWYIPSLDVGYKWQNGQWKDDITGELYTGPVPDYIARRVADLADHLQSAPSVPDGPTTDNPLGKLAIYKDGELVDYTGFETFEGAPFYFEHGVIRDDLAGVVKLDEVWYAFDHGRLMTDEMLVPFETGVFFFKDGVIDQSKSGLTLFNGERFAFAYGQFQPTANGAWMNINDGLWYYMVNGQFVAYTGLVPYDGAIFYFVDGQLAIGFNGVVTDADGVAYTIVGGQAQ